MIAEAVPLRFSSRTRAAYLRDLTGHDERAVSSTSTADAIGLLDSLLAQPFSGENRILHAADLTASDRDRLLIAIYQRIFGDRIENTLTCALCDQPFDLHFSLRELTETIYSQASREIVNVLPDGSFEHSHGFCFRLPIGSDELASMGLPPEDAAKFLFDRSIVDEGDLAGQAFEEMLDDIAPIIDVNLSANCAECGHLHTIEFDIQSYLLGALVGERGKLMSEVHFLATTYGWSLDEILTLTRNERRELVGLIENDTPPGIKGTLR